jgi:hypothetical protein
MESVQVDKLRREFLSLTNQRSEIEDRVQVQKALKLCVQKEMSSISQQLDYTRWSAALELFVMMKIEVDESIIKNRQASIERDNKGKQRKIKLLGVSTILGLPLMNNGVFDGKLRCILMATMNSCSMLQLLLL